MSDTQPKHDVSLGTLYDFNKQLMSKEKKLTKEQILAVKEDLTNWFSHNNYAMLLCRERYDFTVFVPLKPSAITDELFGVLKNRGKILSIEKDSKTINEDAWEIWVKIGDEPFAYYLFNCEDWIIRS